MQIHFISGLPRSGSTLLEGILRQNPRFHAAISGPMSEMFTGLVRSMSGFNDASIFISDDQRERVLRSLFEAYYADLAEGEVIFDTSRNWCSLIPALCELFPTARVVCCVRSPAWILDSIERHVQQKALGTQRMFNHDPKGNEYTRVEALTGKDGFVKRARGNLRQAWFGEFAGRLIAVRYESLVQQPKETIGCTTKSPSRDTLTISIESSTTNRCSMPIWASRAFTAFQVQSEPARGKQSFHRNFLPSAINVSGVPKTRIPAAC